LLFGYVKIAVSFVVPIAVLLYAKQVRHERDRQAILWEVQHPPDLHWVMEHPQQSRQTDRMEAQYLRELIWDLDH
jgi:D-serine deaminase-like pyridoxal phosphate-dependent protein